MRMRRTSTDAGAYQRAISPQEWAHLGNPIGPARSIQLFVQGAGRLDAVELARALATTGSALPGTRLVRRGRMWVDSGRPPHVRTLDGSSLDPTTLSLPGLYRSLRGDHGGPLTEVVLLTGGPPTVVFRAHHGVMDGRGLLMWAAAVFGALRGEAVEPALGTEHEMTMLHRIGVPASPPATRSRVQSVLRSSRAYARRGKILRRRILAGNHPAIIAKVAAAVTEALRLSDASFMVTVDLRRHDPTIRSTGNLVGAINLRVEGGDDWQSVQAQLFDLLADNQELATLVAEGGERILDVPLPMLRPTLRVRDALRARRPETTFTALISRWGRLATEDFATAQFQPRHVFAVPQPGYFLPPSFTILDLPGRTEIVFTCDGGPGMAERADSLLNSIVAALSAAPERRDGADSQPDPDPESPLALIRQQAARTPDAIALAEPEGLSLDYAGLARTVSSLVDALRRLGVRPRDRVAAVLPDGPDAAVAFLAGATAAIFSPLNPAYSPDELRSAFADLAPVLLLVSPGLSTAARRVASESGIPIAELVRSPHGIRVNARLANLGPAAAIPDAGESLLLQTSGTAGQNKLVPLTWPTMLAGARASARAYRLGPADRRLNVMSLFHVQGLVGSVLASLVCGSSAICASSPTPEQILSLLDQFEITWFSASPMMHERILEQAPPGWRPKPNLRFVRSGSAALPPALRERLEDFYRVPVVESYGMTEAHQIASTPLEFGPVGMRPTGSQVRIRTDGDLTVRTGVRGEIVVRGANVIARYLSPGEANADSFVAGWFRTGDEGEFTDDGTLRITGRIKDVIIRGGEKVSPQEVENVLARHPAVRQVVACGVPDPTLNEQVAVIVVRRDGSRVSRSELRQFARLSLAPYKVPTIIEFRSALPTTKGNKISRSVVARELRESAGLSARASAPVAEPHELRTPTERALARIWHASLHRAVPSVHDDFFGLGGQSLDGIALINHVNKTFGVSLDPLVLFDQANTIARMARIIEKRRRRGAAEAPR